MIIKTLILTIIFLTLTILWISFDKKNKQREKDEKIKEQKIIETRKLRSEEPRDKELRSGELRSQVPRDKELRSQELKDKELRNKELKDKELKDKELRNKELKDKELKNEEARDSEKLESQKKLTELGQNNEIKNKPREAKEKVKKKKKRRNQENDKKEFVEDKDYKKYQVQDAKKIKKKAIVKKTTLIKPKLANYEISENQTYKKQQLVSKKEIIDQLSKALHNSGLNAYEIRNKIKVVVNPREEVELEIDLHNMTTELTHDVLIKVLNIKNMNISQIRLIHGYNKGTILKNYLTNEFTHKRIRAKQEDSRNKGVMLIKVKPWDIREAKKKSSILKGQNTTNAYKNLKTIESKKNSIESKESTIDRTSFLLTMVKEKVKESLLKSQYFDTTFKTILREDELHYCNEIFKYEFELRIFLENLREFYIYNDCAYIKITFKKKSENECMTLLKQIIKSNANRNIYCVIKCNKNAIDHVLGKATEICGDKYQLTCFRQSELLLEKIELSYL